MGTTACEERVLYRTCFFELFTLRQADMGMESGYARCSHDRLSVVLCFGSLNSKKDPIARIFLQSIVISCP